MAPKITLSVDQSAKDHFDSLYESLQAKGVVKSRAELFRALIGWTWANKLNDLDFWREVVTWKIKSQ